MNYAEFYKRGLAVGQSNIYKDIVFFRFKKEEFTFPTFVVYDLMHWNGEVFEADVEALRELQKNPCAT